MRRYDLVTFGETMVRLTPTGGLRLEEASSLDVTIGGTESNVCVALARLGRRVAWLSALADNPLGRRVDGELRRHGVDTSHVIWTSDRAGVYFMDPGTRPRPTRVYYDRANSAVARIDPSAVDRGIVIDAGALHLTGITPALSDACATVCRLLAAAAVEAGTPVVFDVNYRSKLWSPEQAASGLAPLLEQTTLLLCGASDAATIWGLRGDPPDVAAGLLGRSGAQLVVLTLAEDGALALHRDGTMRRQPAVPVEIVDAVGAGDAFAAGFLSCWLDDRENLEAALRAGAALAALKMTVPGDHAIITPSELAEAIALLDTQGADIVR